MDLCKFGGAIALTKGGSGGFAWQAGGDPGCRYRASEARPMLIIRMKQSQVRCWDAARSGGGAPGKLETRCRRNGASEARPHAKGTGHKLVSSS